MSDITTRGFVDTAGNLQLVRHQDETPYLEQNKYEYNNNKAARTAFAVKQASVPNIVIDEWFREGIDVFKYGICPDNTKRIKAKLNSNEFKFLRTNQGFM